MDFEDKMHRQQFEEMYNQYQTPLRKLAYRYNVPVDDIEDMVHDTFLSYARSDYSLELPPDEMRKLLSRILRIAALIFIAAQNGVIVTVSMMTDTTEKKYLLMKRKNP